jgi:hypothetical protein
MKIHENFHLFITYNSIDLEPHNKLNPSIPNKFIIFVLQPIDFTVDMTEIVLNHLLQEKK